MDYHRDQILKAWDEVILKVARCVDNPTNAEITAALAKVCAKLPGLTPDDITAALRAGVEEERRKVAAAERTLRILKSMLDERSDKTLPGLPGLPGGRSLNH